jgi:hypothetical protein
MPPLPGPIFTRAFAKRPPDAWGCRSHWCERDGPQNCQRKQNETISSNCQNCHKDEAGAPLSCLPDSLHGWSDEFEARRTDPPGAATQSRPAHASRHRRFVCLWPRWRCHGRETPRQRRPLQFGLAVILAPKTAAERRSRCSAGLRVNAVGDHVPYSGRQKLHGENEAGEDQADRIGAYDRPFDLHEPERQSQRKAQDGHSIHFCRDAPGVAGFDVFHACGIKLATEQSAAR